VIRLPAFSIQFIVVREVEGTQTVLYLEQGWVYLFRTRHVSGVLSYVGTDKLGAPAIVQTSLIVHHVGARPMRCQGG